MDEGTVQAILGLATAALPFAVGGILWLERKLSAEGKRYQITAEQGDLIYHMGESMLALIKEKCKGDPTKAAALSAAEDLMTKMKATWDDEKGTTDMLSSYLSQLEDILRKL